MAQKILITGAGSYVGARLFLDIQKSHPETAGTYHKDRLSNTFLQLDVTDRSAVSKLVGEMHPKVIIHAAANANASWCEQNPEESLRLNRDSTQFLVTAANAVGAQMYLISSFAAKDPVNVYGRTKKESEEIVKQTEHGYIILRPSLIIGMSPNTTNDRPHNRLLRSIETKLADYDTSWKFQPTYIGHLSSVILEAINREIKNELVPVACPELKSRFDIARDVLSHFNIPVTPIDKHDTSPVVTDSLTALDALRLPKYTYEEMIKVVVEEIKRRDAFLLA